MSPEQRRQIRNKLESQRDEIQHLRAGLETICQRIATISRPNGTTKVLERIAVAALTGADIDEAAARGSS